MSKQKTYNTYRQMFPEFIYDSFKYDVQPDGLHISFCFMLGRNGSLKFEPTAFFPARKFLDARRLSKQTLDTLVFHIGMIELISYWKTYCPPTVVVKPYRLSDEQKKFWKKLYFNGLGEFFYTNGIQVSQDDFMIISDEGESLVGPIDESSLFPAADGDSHIVPIGGGKDSVVTLEILSQGQGRPLPLIMNPRGATEQCVEKAGYSMDEVLVIKRTIHPLLLDLNKKGALNGHTPFSAMLAFYSLLASALTGTRNNIALSNENSANESTVAGSNVNHQYSKSLEFENDFRSYVGNYISSKINYYSFLRPLSELQIAMLFARNEKYFDVFKSCNVGSKTDIWCGHCAKCLFAYIILSPFIEPRRLESIFGKNMLDDTSLRLEFNQLTGRAETKPFECVGTVSEVNDALSITLAKWYPSEPPALLRDFKPQPVTNNLDTLQPLHNLSTNELDVLRQAVGTSTLYRYGSLFNILAHRHILIAGYGREGKSSEALLKRLFPCGNNWDIANNNEEIDARLKSSRYDIILKSPGIPTFFFDGKCESESISSQCDLFLRVYGDRTIGVSGTKGKSTTATLIYHILSSTTESRFILAGNIGIPLFDIIPQLDETATVVAELSCHQLENIHRGPHVAVLLNLFQEHLDHYRDYEGYKMAKLQMALKQGPCDYFIYCDDNADLADIVHNHESELMQSVTPYRLSDVSSLNLDGVRLPLQGDHNLSNIYAVSLVAKLWSVCSDSFCRALESFKGLSHRLERVDEIDGVTYYDDSISTIPQTTIAAVEALRNVDVLILGGFDRGIDYSPLAAFLQQSELGRAIGTIVLFGNAGRSIMAALNAVGDGPERYSMEHFGSDYSMEEAVRFASCKARQGSVVLLSPAASSYDHYKNFEYRGDDFKECVARLKKQ